MGAPRGYHLATTPLHSGEALYASSRTRAAHDAWKAGAGYAARLICESIRHRGVARGGSDAGEGCMTAGYARITVENAARRWRPELWQGEGSA